MSSYHSIAYRFLPVCLNIMSYLPRYSFSRPDASDNILFEPPKTDSSAEIAVIRAATINKLVERVTSHTCFDSRTIRTFLQVVIAFCMVEFYSSAFIKFTTCPLFFCRPIGVTCQLRICWNC